MTLVVVTRPEPECSRWTQTLKDQGFAAVALPFIDIVYTPFDWFLTHQSKLDAVVFVSRSAVEGFFRTQPKNILEGARLLVTGPGTRAALIQQGFQPDQMDCPPEEAQQFDSEALWQVIGQRPWAGTSVLIVRGANHAGQPEGRPWLAAQLAGAGANVGFVSTYQRRLPVFTALQNEVLMTAQRTPSVWLLSSSVALAHLQHLVPYGQWHQAIALTSHPRIQTAAQQMGFGQVLAVRPVLAEVSQALRHIFARHVKGA